MADLSFGPDAPEVVSLRRLVPLPQISKPMLQNICVINGLLKSGNKADLHKRIIDREYHLITNPPCRRGGLLGLLHRVDADVVGC